MEFGEKIQKLRSQNNWTQEQLAEKLYVSRTAVSKWESGKGYPNIDLLKDIAKLFNKTIDELLSSEEILDIAKIENTSNMKRTNNLIYGLLDVISVSFIFLPLYARKTENFVYSVPLVSTNDISYVVKIACIIILLILSVIGISEIVLNFVDDKKVQRIVNGISLVVQTISILFFALARQTYLTAIVFILLVIKISIIAKNIANKKEIL